MGLTPTIFRLYFFSKNETSSTDDCFAGIFAAGVFDLPSCPGFAHAVSVESRRFAANPAKVACLMYRGIPAREAELLGVATLIFEVMKDLVVRF